jgi:hypothetical protein
MLFTGREVCTLFYITGIHRKSGGNMKQKSGTGARSGTVGRPAVPDSG